MEWWSIWKRSWENGWQNCSKKNIDKLMWHNLRHVGIISWLLEGQANSKNWVDWQRFPYIEPITEDVKYKSYLEKKQFVQYREKETYFRFEGNAILI